MIQFTARGADSAEAMDQILRRLGANALILSTRVRDGLVEIEATDALPGETAPVAAPVSVTPPSGESPAQRAKTFADLLGARADWPPAPSLQPAVPARRTPWARSSPSVRVSEIAERLERDFLSPDPAQPGQLMPRTVIVGPPGAGKSLLAVRMAAEAMLADRSLRPRIVAPRLSAPLSEDRLRGWSRLIGVLPERPLIGDLMAQDETAEADALRPELIDLSDIATATPDLVAALARPMPTEVVLVLPAGLSPRRSQHEAAPWVPLSPRLCLSFCDRQGPDRAQMSALAEAGLRLARATQGSGVIDAISRPDRAQLARWLQEEACEDDKHSAEVRI